MGYDEADEMLSSHDNENVDSPLKKDKVNKLRDIVSKAEGLEELLDEVRTV